jgi:O-antigen ligase
MTEIDQVHTIKFKFHSRAIFLLLFPSFALASTFWSCSPSETALSATVLMTVAGAIFFLPRFRSNLFVDASKWISLLFIPLLFVLTIVTLIWPNLRASPRIFSYAFDGPNPAGMFLALLALGILPIKYFHSGSRQFNVVITISLFLGGFLVGLSGTRMGVVAFVGGLLAFVVLSKIKGSIFLFFASLAGLSLGSFKEVTSYLIKQEPSRPIIRGLSDRIFGDSTNDFSSGRLAIWRESIAGVDENSWFGSGFDTTQDAFVFMAHNQAITLFQEVGYVGFFLSVLFFIQILRDCGRQSRRNPWVPMLLASCFILIGESVLFGWRNPVAMLIWFAVIAALSWSARPGSESVSK